MMVTKPILLNETGERMADALAIIASGKAENRVITLTETPLVCQAVDAVGIPIYIESDNLPNYAEYGITETGWYIFARVLAKAGSFVSGTTTVTGAAGYIAELGADHVDVAVRFGVTAEAQTVTVDWGPYVDSFVFRAPDLAVRNLDYRTTFYVYDAAPFAQWQYALTTDETFQEGSNYFTEENGEYTLAEVTPGDPIPADTYYKHSKIIFSGMTRNITYQLDEIIDCPAEFILPVVEDDGHGCWFELRLRHAGSYSSTLTPLDPDVKVATEHTQAETAGLNTIDLHYLDVCGVKLWRFLNTHSTIPA